MILESNGASVPSESARWSGGCGHPTLLPQQLGLLRVVFPVEGLGEFGGGVGALGAVGEHGDVDDLVFDAGAAAVVAPQGKQHRAEAEPVVAGQPREEDS